MNGETISKWGLQPAAEHRRPFRSGSGHQHDANICRVLAKREACRSCGTVSPRFEMVPRAGPEQPPLQPPGRQARDEMRSCDRLGGRGFETGQDGPERWCPEAAAEQSAEHRSSRTVAISPTAWRVRSYYHPTSQRQGAMGGPSPLLPLLPADADALTPRSAPAWQAAHRRHGGGLQTQHD